MVKLVTRNLELGDFELFQRKMGLNYIEMYRIFRPKYPVNMFNTAGNLIVRSKR